MLNKTTLTLNELRNKLVAEILTTIDDMELYYKERYADVEDAEVYDRIFSNVSGKLSLEFDLLDMEELGFNAEFYLKGEVDNE